jgi:isoquinoline 1-oxidoreductase
MNSFLSDMPHELERYELDEQPRYVFEPDRREFFQLLGAGLVVALATEEVLAQQRGRGGFGGGQAPQDLGAWIHIGKDGKITAFTGKVEIGQNIRTSLAQAVAEELRVPAASIEMVMSDTGRTPFDGGTAGSQSTPRMAPQLHRVGAAAREILLDMAAERLKVDRKTLVVAEGKVTHPPTKQALSYGELTEGKKLVHKVSADAATTPPSQWKVAGQSVPKLNGRALVTGQHQYAADVNRPGMLFGKVLRPPAYGATLVSVDTKGAQSLPNVTVVHDGNFVGVAAPNEQLAERALEAIRADWKTVPQPSSKELFTYLKQRAQAGQGQGGRGGKGGGRGGGQTVGSIEDGLKAADHTLEAVYTVPYIAHAPLEPRVAVAEWEQDRLTVWTGTQRPFGVRGDLANAFRISADKVHVIVPDTGSGYGGKHNVETATEAARLAKAAGKPVKVLWTREEEFTWAYFRPAGVIEVKSGVRNDGTLTAWEFHNYNSGGSAIGTPYTVVNQRVAAHTSQSPLRQGSYRALASTANCFAREVHMDEIARAISMDPLALRLKNLKEPRLRAVLEAAAKQFGWGQAKTRPGQGFGLGLGTEKGSFVATCAEVFVDPASKQIEIVRLVTAFECGAVVNPEHLKNQVEGAVTMGVGGALFEAIQFADGKILNPRFSRYRVPRFGDAPRLETVLLDRKDLASAGAGETPIVGVAPALANALFDATGIRRRALPLAPEGTYA